MDRIETDTVADAHGFIHLHVGAPGARVHVCVEANSDRPAGATDEFATSLVGRVWLTDALLDEFREDGRP